MKKILWACLAIVAMNAFAETDYVCRGKNHKGKDITITWDEWADSRNRPEVQES